MSYSGQRLPCRFASRNNGSFVRQRGFLMPLALFIILIMGGMALTVARYTGQSATATVQEEITVRAFYAAESGAQFAMNRVLYDTANAITQGNAQTRCDNLASPLSFTAAGMQTCSANLSCTYSNVSRDSYFTINSIGICGTGTPFRAQRTVVVSSFLQ